MAARLQIYRYVLVPRAGAPGDRGADPVGRERAGLLVRDVEHGGVGCVHPWPELGDATLAEELAALASGEPLRLGARALECAAVDARARAEGASLFAGMEIPASHFLWDPGREAGRQGEEVAAGGYPAVKLKLGSDPELALARLAAVAELVQVPLRLDFNSALTAEAARDFFRSLGEDLRRRIELVEDPCPYDAEAWLSLAAENGIGLALDWRRPCPGEGGPPAGVSSLVFKPARDDVGMLGGAGLPVLVTSCMEHPIGQLWAAWWAARIAGGALPGVDFLGCGLLTHRLFRGDRALDLVAQDGARLLAPDGTGLGFDGYLEGLEWEELP